MKQYIVDALNDGQKVILYFGKEYTRTFDQLINKFDGSNELIELGQSDYETSYLINLNSVDFVKIQKPMKQVSSS